MSEEVSKPMDLSPCQVTLGNHPPEFPLSMGSGEQHGPLGCLFAI